MNTINGTVGGASSEILVPHLPGAPPRDPLANALGLPCNLVLDVPVLRFTVGTLMRLTVGDILETAFQHNEDLALTVNGQFVGLVEFDVIGDRLAVRITGMV